MTQDQYADHLPDEQASLAPQDSFLDKILSYSASAVMIACAVATGFEVVSTVVGILGNASSPNIDGPLTTFTYFTSSLNWWRAGVFLGVLTLATLALGLASSTVLINQISKRSNRPWHKLIVQVGSGIAIGILICVGVAVLARRVPSCNWPSAKCIFPRLVHYKPLVQIPIEAVGGVAVGLCLWLVSSGETRVSRRRLLIGALGLAIVVFGLGAIAFTHADNFANEIPPPPEPTWLESHFVSHLLGVTGVVQVQLGPQCTDNSHCLILGRVASRDGIQSVLEVSNNGGSTWHAILARGLPPNAIWVYGAFHCIDSNHCWLSSFIGSGSGMYFSDDGGRHWVGHLGNGAPQVVGPSFGVSCPSASVCYVTSFSGMALWKTDNGGKTWDRELTSSTGLTSFRVLACSGVETCIVVRDNQYGSVLVSTNDGGHTWNTLTTPSGHIASFNSLSCPTLGVCYVLWSRSMSTGEVPASGTLAVLTTVDNGLTWSETPIPASLLKGYTGNYSLTCPDARDCLIVASVGNTSRATSTFTLQTDDGGTTWSSDRNVRLGIGKSGWVVGQIECTNARICWIVIVKGSRGINFVLLRSEDFGKTWRKIDLAPVSVGLLNKEYPS